MHMPNYYPIYMNVQRRRCVVIGGGPPGEEKVTRLLDCEADVVVVSPELTGRLHSLARSGRITWIERGYEPGDIEGAVLAIVADTSDEGVNRRAAEEAEARNVPLNVMDVTHLCTFIAPSIARRGPVTVATSTNGRSPALARLFRERLTGSRLLEYADLAPLLSDVRSELMGKGMRVPPDQWQIAITEQLLDMVQAGRYDEARRMLMDGLVGAHVSADD